MKRRRSLETGAVAPSTNKPKTLGGSMIVVELFIPWAILPLVVLIDLSWEWVLEMVVMVVVDGDENSTTYSSHLSSPGAHYSLRV
jgi:hypothetical protein